MSIKEYLENLNRLKQLAVDRWGSLSSLERNVFDGAYDWLIDNLEIKRGEIVVDEDLSRIMDEFMKAVVDTVNNVPAFQSKLKQFLQDLTTIQTNNKTFHATTNKFDINTAGVNNVQKAVVNEIIDQYTANGLNVHFAAPLKENIFRNILAGANMKDVRQVLQTYILSGQDKSGKLGQYLDQTAMMAVDSYTGAINQQLVNEFTFTGYIISGSLIETSSKQCVYAVEEADQRNGYLPFSEWEKILEIARNNPKARLIPGTTIKNLPLNKLHWGCRHDFTPVIMAEDVKKPEPKKKEEEKPETKKQDSKPTVISEKERLQQVMKKNTSFTPGKVSVSQKLPIERLQKMINKYEELSSEYNLSPGYNRDKPVDFIFNSGQRYFGQIRVRPIKDSSQLELVDINFGSEYEKAMQRDVDVKIQATKFNSHNDPENDDVSVVVHEFGHTISLSQLETFESSWQKYAGFWPEMKALKKEYHEALGKVINDNDEYAKIFLGKYASTNVNEFMAEGFKEYKLSSTPSEYAKKIGILIDKYFKK